MRPSEALAKHRNEVLAILARYPVSNPRVFGSVARGEDKEGSDLDLLVERTGPMSYFDIFHLEDELKSVLHCEVEVFTNLKPHVAVAVATELRAL
jgi:uncharacterized protein